MLELYHADPSANSAKPMICLQEKGLDFESRFVDFGKFEQHSPEFTALNPNGQVPVLVHDGAVITESTVINEYLDEVFPEVPLRPADPAERARMRIWSKFIDEYFCPPLSMIGWHMGVRRMVENMTETEVKEMLARIPLEEQRQKWAIVAGNSFPEAELEDSRRRLRFSMERIEAILARSTWLAGTSYSLADINSFSMVAALPRLCPEILSSRDTPRSIDWLRRMSERRGVQAALAMARNPGLSRSVPDFLKQLGG